MASTRVLLSSSSPTPAHQLHHPFRRFDPQPSPLSNSQLFRNRNTLQNHFHQELNSDGYLDDDDDDEELALNEGQDFVEDHYGDEAECQSFQDEAADDNDEVESSEANPNGERDVEADDDYEDGDQQSLIGELDSFDGNYLSVNGLGFSPTLDASFATSMLVSIMSIGTIPPTPSINNTLDSPSEPRNSHSLRHGQTSFLPAHLFAPNPNAMPPSSSPHRMDVSPVPKASHVNNPLNLPSPDPFRCPQRQWQPWSTSPPPSEARRTIALRKPCARPSIISPEPMAISSSELHKSVPSRSSPAAVTDGMDIDSPSYSQQHIIPPDSDYFEHSLEEFEDHSGPQHVDRSGSQCSIGKRSRSSEEELDEDSGLEEDLTRLSRPTSRGSGASHWRRTTSVAGPSNLFAPRGGRNHGKFSFSPNSSPSQAVSPSVKAASSKAMSFGKKSDKSISGFKVSSTWVPLLVARLYLDLGEPPLELFRVAPRSSVDITPIYKHLQRQVTRLIAKETPLGDRLLKHDGLSALQLLKETYCLV
ncbi:hypothetical protein BY996DRAFT_93605 [Phakopsora pachyrhizi]|nr:hypothetical protein BY996DRAFT_93605 [Phakopsora pachyrhizi]